ncbi:MAG: protein translocase subunit SecF [Bacteriovoracaceae bacterium]
MIELIRNDLNINFVKHFKLVAVLSIVVTIGTIVLFFTKGFNYGIDFRGGAELQVKFKNSTEVELIREALAAGKIDNASVQSIGEKSENEFLVRTQGTETGLNQLTIDITNSLKAKFSAESFEIRKTDIVGPKAGAELRRSAFLALIWAFLSIMIYIGLRFDFKYAPGAVVSLLHDTIFTCGVFIVLQKEFTLQTVAALLTIIGYSINDTVVVYDRIKENEQKDAGKTLAEHINKATNETMSRTILTVSTVLFVSLAMYLFGGPSIKDFFFAMLVGCLVGTYSSVFIAAPLTLLINKIRK